MNHSILLLDNNKIEQSLCNIDAIAVMNEVFSALAKNQAVQPAQSLTLFPDHKGDFITYQGVIADKGVFGAKLSPYIVGQEEPIITAWTLLMSMHTGQPLMLCDAASLTRYRTAAVTALAIKLLAKPESRKLAIIGSGPLALTHLKLALPIVQWQQISLFSPSLQQDQAKQQLWQQIYPEIEFCQNAAEACQHADVIMLCTSSGSPVIQSADIQNNALITSISTNVFQAHEIDPIWLSDMDVYCDYKATTPTCAGEMVLAQQNYHWQSEQIIADLADLVCDNDNHFKPDYSKPVFFRSMGLGIEDIAIANAIYQYHLNNNV